MSPSSVSSNLGACDSGIGTSESGLLNDFFNWRHPQLVADPDHSQSTSTRGPGFYDMHIHEDLQLKRIVIFEELPQRIASICDKAMANDLNSPRFIPGKGNFPTTEKRKKALESSQGMVNEETLREQYAKTIANFCSTVASTLNFELKEWAKVFLWTSEATVLQANGKADGFLSINRAKMSLLGEVQQQEVLLMEKYLLNHFVIWEFKSLVAGSLSVMQGIAEHEGDFIWTTCSSPRGCEHHCTDGRVSITGRKTGPDATRQSWSDSISSELGGKRKREDTDEFTLPLPTPLTETLPSSTSDENSCMNRDKYSPSLNQCSHDILQQVWSQTVKNDATYFIINAGNFEYVGMRERETQTMFLSELLVPSEETEPTQVKLHTAIMMAGYYDTLNRAKQLDNMAHSNRLPPLYTFCYDRDNHKYPEHRQSQPTLTKSQKREQGSKNDMALISMLQNAKSIDFRPPPQITDSALFYKLHKKNPQGEGLLPDSEPTLRLDAHTKLGGERTRLVLMVNFETSKSFSGKLVVKYATSDDEKTALQNEYDAYCRLVALKYSFIVQVYGIFTGCLDGISYDFLFMENGGESLHDRFEVASRPQRISLFKKYGKLLEKAKSELHRHGYIHGNLRKSHILVNTAKKRAYFASLARCRQIEVEPTGPPQKKRKSTCDEQFRKDSEELDQLLLTYIRPN